MSKEFELWWQTVKDKPGNRYEDAFTAGRALGRREMKGDSDEWPAFCKAMDEGRISVILEGADTSIDGGIIVTSADDVLDHIEAIPEEV